MKYQLMELASSILFVAAPASVLALPIESLNAQLQPAVELNQGVQALQIGDPMKAAQASNGQKELLLGSSTLSSNFVAANVNRRQQVIVTNALVARREVRNRDFFTGRRQVEPLVRYNLKMELYNGTSGIVRDVHVYYDILSWNENYNESGSLVIPDIQADRTLHFEEPLQWRAVPQDSRNRYEGVRVRINRVEWFNEDGSTGTNLTPVKFGYWGKL